MFLEESFTKQSNLAYLISMFLYIEISHVFQGPIKT